MQPPPLLLAALLALCPLGAEAAEPLGKPVRARDDGAIAGFGIDSAVILSVKQPKQREAYLDRVALWAVQNQAGTSENWPERTYIVDCIAALLKDFFRHPRPPSSKIQVFFPSKGLGQVRLTEFVAGGKALETIGVLEPTGTGWAAGDKIDYGLSVYARAGDSAEMVKPYQYLGNWGMERFSWEVGSRGAWWAAVVGPKTWAAPVVTRLYRKPDGTWEDRGHVVKKEASTLQSASSLLGRMLGAVDAVDRKTSWAKGPACAGADLSLQFPTPLRDQCAIGSCHAFAIIGIVEAALLQGYSVPLRLSEADLFVNRTLKDRSHIAEASKSGPYQMAFQEGAYPKDNLEHVLAHGVATSRSVPYERTEERYTAARLDASKGLRTLTDEYEKLGALDRVTTAEPREAAAERQAVGSGPFKTAEIAGAEVNAEAIDKERAVVREALRGFSLHHRGYGPEAAGVDQRRDMVDLLCAGVPVAVSMDLIGLSEWGVTDLSEHAPHAFIVTGFRQEKDGLVFTTRNSWGAAHLLLRNTSPDIPERQLSRVDALDALLPPPNLANSFRRTAIYYKLLALQDSKPTQGR